MSFPNAPVFHHDYSDIGTLTIENGIDQCAWGYNLNTAVIPTYGGEVIQILSVYIDDVTIGGTVSTYSQAEAIYSYFATYMQYATQGPSQTPQAGSSYIAEHMTFTYPARGWTFQIFPKTAPGFAYSFDTVAPTWQITAHVEDDNPNLRPIKNAIASSVASTASITSFKRLNGEISPQQGDPESDPFQTYSSGNVTTGLQSAANFYNSLVNAYATGNFNALTAAAPGTGGGSSSGGGGGGGGTGGGGGGGSGGGGGGSSGPATAVMTKLLAYAESHSTFGEDGYCLTHVEQFMVAVGYPGGTHGVGHAYAWDFGVDAKANAAAWGLKVLQSGDPYDAPAGGIVVVPYPNPGTGSSGKSGLQPGEEGDICVASGTGQFYNGGQNSFGGKGAVSNAILLAPADYSGN